MDRNIYEAFLEIKQEMKEEILEVLVPTIQQVADSVHNSNVKTLEAITAENKTLKQELDGLRRVVITKNHLGIIYTILFMLLFTVGFLFISNRQLEQRELTLEKEFRELMVKLIDYRILVNDRGIYIPEHSPNSTPDPNPRR